MGGKQRAKARAGKGRKRGLSHALRVKKEWREPEWRFVNGEWKWTKREG